MTRISKICSLLFAGLLVSGALFAQSGLADRKKKAEGLARAAVASFQSKGAEATYALINDKKGPFTEGEFYVFAYDLEATCVAHGQTPARVGKNFLASGDANGKKYYVEMVALAKSAVASGWVDYMFKNPTSGKVEPKISFVVRVPGQNVFMGCGTYVSK